MKKKVLALTLAAFVACGAAGCGGEEKKPAPKPENKQTTNVKKDEKQKAPEKKVDPAVKHAQDVMKLPHDSPRKEEKIYTDWYETLLVLLHNQIPGLYRQIFIGKRKLERISFLRRAVKLPGKNKAAFFVFNIF